jgi:ABC-type glycerol-3-phosphate transport system permease component
MDVGLIIIYVALGLAAIASLFPLVHTVALSLSSSARVNAGEVVLWPLDVTIQAYARILEDAPFWTAFWVSVKRVVLAVTLGGAMVVITAFPLSRTTKDFRLRDVFAWLVVITMLFSPPPLIPWFLTIRGLHLVGTIWALVLPGLANQFLIIICLNFFRKIPKELDESASIDGASPWAKLVRIYVPLSKPVLATISLFTLVWHWNAFFDGLIFTTHTEQYPLQTYIQQLVVNINPNRMTEEDARVLAEVSNKALNAAKIVVTMIPVIVVYPFMQKFFIHGIMLGSLKE